MGRLELDDFLDDARGSVVDTAYQVGWDRGKGESKTALNMLQFREEQPPYFKHREAFTKTVIRHAGYLSVDEQPDFRHRRDPYYPVRLYGDFIWGPKGEWTGFPRIHEFDESYSDDYYSEARTLARYPIGVAIAIARLDPRGRRIAPTRWIGDFSAPPHAAYTRDGYAYRDITQVLSFESYADQACWRRIVSGDSRYQYGLGEEEVLAEELVSALMPVHSDPLVFKTWIGALTSGRYQPGYGALKDREGRFDALGVLADISGAKWRWNASEGVYGTRGGTVTLTPEVLVEYLGKPSRPATLLHFAETLGTLADSLDSLPKIGRMLEVADQFAEEQRVALSRTLDRARPRMDRSDIRQYMIDPRERVRYLCEDTGLWKL